ncbi:MAG: hypothetical protein KBC64_00095 [Simkaniaceae bacterium]|nr:hypothetical protein [Simkaniaceae bacterium]
MDTSLALYSPITTSGRSSTSILDPFSEHLDYVNTQLEELKLPLTPDEFYLFLSHSHSHPYPYQAIADLSPLAASHRTKLTFLSMVEKSTIEEYMHGKIAAITAAFDIQTCAAKAFLSSDHLFQLLKLAYFVRSPFTKDSLEAVELRILRGRVKALPSFPLIYKEFIEEERISFDTQLISAPNIEDLENDPKEVLYIHTWIKNAYYSLCFMKMHNKPYIEAQGSLIQKVISQQLTLLPTYKTLIKEEGYYEAIERGLHILNRTLQEGTPSL